MSTEEKGLTVVSQSSGALTAFEPSSLSSAMQLAEMLCKSRLMPTAFKQPADVLLAMMTGRELGLTTMQSLRSLHVVEGKVGMSAELMLALVKQKPQCSYLRVVESTDKACVMETQRQGDPEPTRMSYTIEQAQRAGVAGKDNWKRHTEAMLRARCASALCRAVYPDLLLGVYSEDEIDEIASARRSAPIRVESHQAVEADEVQYQGGLLVRIQQSESLADLEALVPEVQKAGLPSDQMKALRAAYGTRKKALQAEAAKAQVADAEIVDDGEVAE